MKVYQCIETKRHFVETGVKRVPLKGDYYNFRGIAGGPAFEDWTCDYYTEILCPIRFYELLCYKLSQWFKLLSLFRASLIIAIGLAVFCKLIWVLYYGA